MSKSHRLIGPLISTIYRSPLWCIPRHIKTNISCHNKLETLRKTLLTRSIAISDNLMLANNGLDLALINILDNDDPFTDSELRDSGEILIDASGEQTLIPILPGNKISVLQVSNKGLTSSTPNKKPDQCTISRSKKDSSACAPVDGTQSSSFEFSDIDDEFIEAMEAAETNCRPKTKHAVTTPSNKSNSRLRRLSTSSLSTPTRKKTCKYIQTTSQGSGNSFIQESQTGVEIVKTQGHPNNVTLSSTFSLLTESSAPVSVSQLRNPFNVPTQFQRQFSTSATGNGLSSRKRGANPYHVIVLATQSYSTLMKKMDEGSLNELDDKVVEEIVEEDENKVKSHPKEGHNSKSVKPIILSMEQEYVLKQVMLGVSLFYTGSAGTGKSVLLRSIIKSLRSERSTGIAVTASTGLAACNIGGITLHSFAGIGLGQGTVDSLIKKVRRNKKAYKRWQETSVLIIDEISMVDGHLLNKLNSIAKRIRRSHAPFGGIQLVACGDFYQLPPVVKKTQPDGTEDPNIEAFFAFESEAWSEAIQQTITLQEIFRQKGDQVFIDMLNEIRDGKISEGTISKFRQLERPLRCPQGFVPSELYATRAEVERANNRKLDAVDGSVVNYEAIDSGILPKKQQDQLLSNFLAPQYLKLKVGAQVMCIKNFDDRLVNGTLGKVIDFVDKDTYLKALVGQPDTKKTKSDATGAAESASDDYVFNDFKRPDRKVKEDAPIFDQVITTSQIVRANMSKEEIANSKRKSKLESDLIKDFKNRKYPLVKFLLPDGVTFRTVLVEPEQWTVEDEDGNVIVSRVQFPLMLAWSLSIHKSQGQTLSKVVVNMRNIFETGQAYVALSRAVSREGLQVLNFNPYRIASHPKVVQFYGSLTTHKSETVTGQRKLNFSRGNERVIERALI